jgi:hypothetical protein
MIIAETPSTMFTEMMMNQTTHLTHPSAIRRRVIPNEVLLHAAARMFAKPAEYEIRDIIGMLL